jgi:hypothetical protein
MDGQHCSTARLAVDFESAPDAIRTRDPRIRKTARGILPHHATSSHVETAALFGSHVSTGWLGFAERGSRVVATQSAHRVICQHGFPVTHATVQGFTRRSLPRWSRCTVTSRNAASRTTNAPDIKRICQGPTGSEQRVGKGTDKIRPILYAKERPRRCPAAPQQGRFGVAILDAWHTRSGRYSPLGG